MVSITVYAFSSADLLNTYLDFIVTQLDFSTDGNLLNLKKNPNNLFCKILQIPSFSFLAVGHMYRMLCSCFIYAAAVGCSCCWMEGSGFENTSLQQCLLLWPQLTYILSYWKIFFLYFSPPWKVSAYFQWISVFEIKAFLVSQKIKYVMLKNLI